MQQNEHKTVAEKVSQSEKTAAARVPNKQLRRCLAIIKALTRNRHGLTKSEIYDYLREENIPLPEDRTFVRDMEELRVNGYNIVASRTDYRYRLCNREEVVSRAFAIEEIQALQMCRDLFKYFDGTHLKASIDSAIDAVVGGQETPFTKDDIEDCRDNFIVHLAWRHDFLNKEELLDKIAYGVNNDMTLRVTYKKPNQDSETSILEPYKIVLYHDSLYLLAKRENDEWGLRLFHISRIENIEETYREFSKSSKLIRDYEASLEHCFGIWVEGELYDVEIDFDKSVEDSVCQRVWHKSQSIVSKEDCVTLKLRVYRSGEFMAWVRGWGEAVKATRFEVVTG